MCASAMQAQGAKSALGLANFRVRGQWDPERVVFPLQAIAFGRMDADGGGREALSGQFGLVPEWVDEAKGGAKFGRHCYNARTETVFEKPSYRKAILARRAAVPVDCFYEFPDKEAPLRHRFKIAKADGTALWLAAIWERNEALGLTSVSVLTTGPLDIVAPFHSRSPLILDPDQLGAWLDPGLKVARSIAKTFKVHGSQGLRLEQEDWGKPKAQGELF